MKVLTGLNHAPSVSAATLCSIGQFFQCRFLTYLDMCFLTASGLMLLQLIGLHRPQKCPNGSTSLRLHLPHEKCPSKASNNAPPRSIRHRPAPSSAHVFDPPALPDVLLVGSSRHAHSRWRPVRRVWPRPAVLSSTHTSHRSLQSMTELGGSELGALQIPMAFVLLTLPFSLTHVPSIRGTLHHVPLWRKAVLLLFMPWASLPCLSAFGTYNSKNRGASSTCPRTRSPAS